MLFSGNGPVRRQCRSGGRGAGEGRRAGLGGGEGTLIACRRNVGLVLPLGEDEGADDEQAVVVERDGEAVPMTLGSLHGAERREPLNPGALVDEASPRRRIEPFSAEAVVDLLEPFDFLGEEVGFFAAQAGGQIGVDQHAPALVAADCVGASRELLVFQPLQEIGVGEHRLVDEQVLRRQRAAGRLIGLDRHEAGGSRGRGHGAREEALLQGQGVAQQDPGVRGVEHGVHRRVVFGRGEGAGDLESGPSLAELSLAPGDLDPVRELRGERDLAANLGLGKPELARDLRDRARERERGDGFSLVERMQILAPDVLGDRERARLRVFAGEDAGVDPALPAFGREPLKGAPAPGAAKDQELPVASGPHHDGIDLAVRAQHRRHAVDVGRVDLAAVQGIDAADPVEVDFGLGTELVGGRGGLEAESGWHGRRLFEISYLSSLIRQFSNDLQ